MPKLKYIFVHGLSGWGQYDSMYKRMPYWGMHGGDLISFLRKSGFDCYAASVDPTGSAWDRACELYAQIAGKRTDYGKYHSEQYNHARYGKDFTDRPLIKEWSDDTRLVLIGHSFGGVTARLFAELLSNGDRDEQNSTRDGSLSELFKGGYSKRIFSIVTLAAPTNGTTAYDLFEDPDFDPSSVKVPVWSKAFAKMMSAGTSPKRDYRDPKDYADYDMHVDRAKEINERIQTLPEVYYFSVPCSKTALSDGKHVPQKGMEQLFTMRSYQIGAYTGTTRGGIAIGEEWKENDGLVNTYSALAPHNAPRCPYDAEKIEPGIWNVLPVLKEDHMYLQGGLGKRHNIRPFYTGLITMIDELYNKETRRKAWMHLKQSSPEEAPE